MSPPATRDPRALPSGGVHPSETAARGGTGDPAARGVRMRARGGAIVDREAARRSVRAYLEAQRAGDGHTGRRRDPRQRAARSATRRSLSYDGAPASRPQSHQHRGQEPQADVGHQGHHRQAAEDARRERCHPPSARGATRGCRDASSAAAYGPEQQRERQVSSQLPPVLHGRLSGQLERRILRVHADLPRKPRCAAGPGAVAGPVVHGCVAEAACRRGHRLPFAGVGTKLTAGTPRRGSP
jgi:hypothetical protein